MGVGARAQACACTRVGLLIQYPIRRRHNVLPGSTTFRDIMYQTNAFGKGGGGEEVNEHKMCVLIFSTTFISKRLHVEYPLYLSNFNET